jgi:uncharacterized protein
MGVSFMKAFITGGSGFVGTNLTGLLVNRGHQVTILSRGGKGCPGSGGRVNFVQGDPTVPGKWQESVAEHDVLINLAGATIFKRWDASYKERLRNSRILTTRNLVDAIPDREGSVKTLLSTSAVGYYGFAGDEELTEDAPAGADFLARLARDWEAEAHKALAKGTRVVIARFGVVLGKNEGALKQMALPFRFFFGGPIGSGKQWFSWIHVDDLCRAALFTLETDDFAGPVNFTAPVPTRNRDLARALGRAMGRPSFMPAPAFMIRLVLGEFGSVILEGQRVIPRVLQDKGFTFGFPRVEEALADLLPR